MSDEHILTRIIKTALKEEDTAEFAEIIKAATDGIFTGGELAGALEYYCKLHYGLLKSPKTKAVVNELFQLMHDHRTKHGQYRKMEEE